MLEPRLAMIEQYMNIILSTAETYFKEFYKQPVHSRGIYAHILTKYSSSIATIKVNSYTWYHALNLIISNLMSKDTDSWTSHD
jgi:hypothetical protein